MLCPVCNINLTIVQKLDHDYNNGDSEGMWQDVTGECEGCGRKFLWTQHYILVNEDSLEDDE